MKNTDYTHEHVNFYSICDCGAISLDILGEKYSCKKYMFKGYFPNIDLRKCKQVRNKFKQYCCDYCVNHYGLDLCACGSGEKIGKCTNELSMCGEPMQIVGKYSRVICANPFGKEGGIVYDNY